MVQLYLHDVAAQVAEAGVVVSVRPRGQRGTGAKRPTEWARELATSGRKAAIVVTSELAAGGAVDSDDVELAAELVVRQSTARPPASAARG